VDTVLSWYDGLREQCVTQTVTSNETSTDSGANKRRSTRLVHAVGLTVAGTDALGRSFREVTKTSVVSCYGCAFRSKNYAPKSSEVTLEVSRGHSWLAPRRVTAKVIWVQRPQNLREQYQIAVALEVPGNVWGVEAPPEDWFPHPEDVVRAAPPPEPAEAAEAATSAAEADTSQSSAESQEAIPQAELDAEVTLIPVPVEPVAPESGNGAGKVEEIVFGRGHLDVQIEEALGATLRSMIGREAEEAVREFARETAERAMAVIAEMRKSSESMADELDAKIRQVLDEAMNLPAAPPPERPPEKWSRKKRWKRPRY
jgi:hypothetical protein